MENTSKDEMAAGRCSLGSPNVEKIVNNNCNGNFMGIFSRWGLGNHRERAFVSPTHTPCCGDWAAEIHRAHGRSSCSGS